MDEIEDNRDVDQQDENFDGGQVVVALLNFDGEQRAGDDDGHPLAPAFGEPQAGSFH